MLLFIFQHLNVIHISSILFLMVSLLNFKMLFMFVQTLYFVVSNIKLPPFERWWKTKSRRMPMFSLSAWLYVQKISMFPTAGSVASGRIFVASPIYFVFCDACFHRSTCSISLMFGDDFLSLQCMFSCFQNLYGLHVLLYSRIWLLDYCRMNFSSEAFGLLFWRNQQHCLKEIFLALSYFTVGPL